MPSVTFDPVAFVTRYQEFMGADTSLLGMYFTEATMYLDNSDASLVTDLGQRAVLLNMLTAHVAALAGAGVNGNGSPGLVGRINSASEGSVSVSADYIAPANGSMAYFLQTPYGASYWAATARYRTMQYMAYSGTY